MVSHPVVLVILNNPMSKEEEKFIEELINIVENNIDKTKIINSLIPLILEAYRAGKLAGFEMCEKMADEMTTGLDMLNQIDAGKVFAIGTFKSLIEEEKKL